MRSRSLFTSGGAIAAMLVAGMLAACSPPTPPTPDPPTQGLDVAAVVSQNTRAVQGTSTAFRASVANVGTESTGGDLRLSVVMPPGHSAQSVSADGWACAVAPAVVDCVTAQTVQPAESTTPVEIVAETTGALGVGSLYGAVSLDGDVDPANDTRRGQVATVANTAGDQVFVQLAGALQLRSGGATSSGDVTVSNDLFGPTRLQVDAQVGATSIQADLGRVAAAVFSGPVTITDPTVLGGEPLTVRWYGALIGRGTNPFNNLSGTQINLRIPSLDLPGISGAALNGITFSLGLTAVDGNAGSAMFTYADAGLNVRPELSVPGRIVSGANFNLDTELVAESGASIGPVSADIDVPDGVTFVGARSGTTCTPVAAVPGRQRCFLDATVSSPISPNVVGRILGSFLPTGTPTISVQLRAEQAFTPLDIRVAVDAANSGVRSSTVTVDARPPGAEVGIALTGPDRTPQLWLAEGSGISGNEYSIAVDNVGTANSAPVTVTLQLPEGVTFRSSTNPPLTTANNRFTCSADGQIVTCTRPNGISVTGLLSPAPSFAVQVDVGAISTATVAASVLNPNDVDPGGAAKSATSTAAVARTGAPTFDLSLSNGAFSATGRPVLTGGFTYDITSTGRLDGIIGCGSSRDFTPAVLAVPIVGPTLVPAQYSDNRLCVNISRVPFTNRFVGSASADFVAPPVFAPGIPPAVPAPPLVQPQPVSVAGLDIVPPVLNADGSVSGSALGANPVLALNGGATFRIDWTLRPEGVTCIDVAACPDI